MESKGMKFAKQIMKNLGWTEGSGLGLNQDGITQPLKPTSKFDVSGLGHKNYNDFQWWDHAFNKAAKAFDIKVTDDDKVVVEKNKDVGKIRTKKTTLVEADTLAYGVFCKTGTLNNGVMEASSTTLTLKEEKDYSLKLSDEELFKMCDGLTAHKGARHGLTASGKLARIAKQEALMLANLNASKIPLNTDLNGDVVSEIKVKKDKKKKRKALELVDSEPTDTKEEQNSLAALIPEDETPQEVKPKKKKKKSKHACEEINAEDCDLALNVEEEQPIDKTEKRKKKKRRTEEGPLLTQEEDVSCTEPKKKKKKNKHNQNKRMKSKRKRKSKYHKKKNMNRFWKMNWLNLFRRWLKE